MSALFKTWYRNRLQVKRAEYVARYNFWAGGHKPGQPGVLPAGIANEIATLLGRIAAIDCKLVQLALLAGVLLLTSCINATSGRAVEEAQKLCADHGGIEYLFSGNGKNIADVQCLDGTRATKTTDDH